MDILGKSIGGEGSTGRLVQLCAGYYFFYVVTGVTVKYFLGSAALGFPGLKGIEFLVYSTLGGMFICLAVVTVGRWYKMESYQPASYIIPSGICTAIIIPTTTLMYTLPISVMVAMVMMRAAVIVISRIVDTVQIRQGILKKKVYMVENIAVGFALLAVGTKILWTPSILGSLGLEAAAGGGGDFEFLKSKAAMGILGSYVIAYAVRIYIMNYYKNTRVKKAKQNNKAFFAIEQYAAAGAILLAALALFFVPPWLGLQVEQIDVYRAAIRDARSTWHWASIAGMAFGMAAFFSVFIFMFKGRTATFAGLVNRLTSLVAGTTATLFFHFVFGGKFPKTPDWVALAFIIVAVVFLTMAERKRAAELKPTSASGGTDEQRDSENGPSPGVASVGKE